MAERHADEASIAPHRTLSGGSAASSVREDVVLPPPPEDLLPPKDRARKQRPEKARREPAVTVPEHVDPPTSARTVRKARLRLVQVEPWSVMKTAFLLSVAFGIVTVVSVFIVWSVLGAAGVWESINATAQDILGGAARADRVLVHRLLPFQGPALPFGVCAVSAEFVGEAVQAGAHEVRRDAGAALEAPAAFDEGLLPEAG